MARVKKLIIRNLLGIEELEIEPGKVTVIRGPNASGKTSVLEAAKAIVKGGHDATLLRDGAEEGEGVLILGDDDGDLEDVSLRKRVTPDRSTLDVRHPTMGKVSAAQTFVDSIHDALSVNPVAFLTSDNRVEILLDALGAEVDADALSEALEGVPIDEFEAPPHKLVRGVEGLPATDAIERVRRAVYNARTGVNRIVREKTTTRDQLAETLPEGAGDPDEIEKEIEVAESAVESLRDEAGELVGEIRKDERERVSEVVEKEKSRTDELFDERDEKVRELQRQIDAVRDEYAGKIAEVSEEADAEVERIEKEAEERVDAITDEYDPRIQETKEEIATLRERLKASEGAARTREMIRENAEAADEARKKSEALSAALERLDGLKESVLDELPIEDAEIRDGELYVGGVHFDRLNSAKRVEIALRVAELRAGDLGLVCVDDLELLDSDHFEAMVERLRESPLQAIVTRVSDDAFEITTEEA